MSETLAEFVAVETRHSPPDPAITRAIGLNHDWATAVADLVDNSVDAGAVRVRVRFVLRDGLAHQLLVADDGHGMGEKEIDRAMRLGSPKADSAGALGHFGMGLKAASFSQASELIVLSRRDGRTAQGRRMLREAEAGAAGFEIDVLDQRQVVAVLRQAAQELDMTVRTMVRWDGLRTVPASTDPEVTNAFVNTKVTELRHHLGLVYHRLLARGQFTVDIDVLDADTGESGFPFPVEPIDPFAYPRSGAARYPKTLVARYDSKTVPMECHVWPGGSDSHCFKLAGGPVDRFQGFYLYRNGRLLSAGGWNGVVQETKRRRLARVAVDIEEHLGAFTMSAEKSSVHMSADLVHAIERATARDRTTFDEYLTVAEEAFRESNRRVVRRTPILPPGQGVAPGIRKVIEREATILDGEEPIRIRWTPLPDGDFIEVDRRDRTLWLNSEYRDAMLKGTQGGVNDVPLIKALLFLLYEDIFRGAAFGPKDKDNVNFWLEVLTAAAQAEQDRFYD